jgi:hypothetical protein
MKMPYKKREKVKTVMIDFTRVFFDEERRG